LTSTRQPARLSTFCRMRAARRGPWFTAMSKTCGTISGRLPGGGCASRVRSIAAT
jgi:hypothetical protein